MVPGRIELQFSGYEHSLAVDLRDHQRPITIMRAIVRKFVDGKPEWGCKDFVSFYLEDDQYFEKKKNSTFE